MIRSTVLALVFILIAAGCGSSKGNGPERTTTIDETRAIEIAQQAVRDNDGWSNGLQWADGSTQFQGYTLESFGKDAADDTDIDGQTDDFDCDIVFVDGQFVSWPEGQQQ